MKFSLLIYIIFINNPIIRAQLQTYKILSFFKEFLLLN